MNVSGIIAKIKAEITPLFETELHKLFGVGVASAGMVNGVTTHAGSKELWAGLGYAALVHLAEVLKPKTTVAA